MTRLMYLLDSVILIDHFKSIRDADVFMVKNKGKCAISVVTRAEVLVGLHGAEFQEAMLFLDQFHLFGIEMAVADKAVGFRRQYGWKLLDAFQAAVAHHHSLKLVTRNTKDFQPEKHPFVTIPYKL